MVTISGIDHRDVTFAILNIVVKLFLQITLKTNLKMALHTSQNKELELKQTLLIN